MRMIMMTLALFSIFVSEPGVANEHKDQSIESCSLRSSALVVVAGQDEGVRVRMASDLLGRIRELTEIQRYTIDNNAIDALSMLLLDRNDFIKSYGADALTLLGGRAKRSLPVLSAALENVNPKSGSGSLIVRQGKMADTRIREAINVIEKATFIPEIPNANHVHC